MNVIAPKTGAEVAQAIEQIPLREVYSERTGETDNRPFCAEWSIRISEERVDMARMMVATKTERCSPGQLSAALGTLKGTSERIRALAEALLKGRPDLDLLLGFALAETIPRAKLYVLRPAGRPIGDFSQLSEDILGMAGVPPQWTRNQIEMAKQCPAFLALDLRNDGSSTGKLYFSFDEESQVDRYLYGLNARDLRKKLTQVQTHISDNPTGRLVVTPRAEGDQTVDVTLHAHLNTLPVLHPALDQAWSRLKMQAQQNGLLPLHYSYASWLSGPTPSESLYYTFSPRSGKV